MHDGEEHRAGGAVHRRVVGLQQHGKAVLWQPFDIVQPFDDVHLPQRLVHIQRPGVDARHENTELAPVAGLGQRYVAHVVFKIKMFVFHPIGAVEFHGHVGQLAGEDG